MHAVCQMYMLASLLFRFGAFFSGLAACLHVCGVVFCCLLLGGVAGIAALLLLLYLCRGCWFPSIGLGVVLLFWVVFVRAGVFVATDFPY